MLKPIIIANWKLNGDKILVQKFIKKISFDYKKYFKKNTIILSPPIIYIEYMKKCMKNLKLSFAVQNVDYNYQGAFTGEISTYMVQEIGAKYVILGHSERRKNHFENNLLVAKKFYCTKINNLIPILCIGETKNEKKSGLTKSILKKQIDEIFLICGKNAFNNTLIAYEPIWAIGTGTNASPILINKILKFIKKYIIYKSDNTNIKFYMQYGGSVSTENIKDIICQKYVDGVLIGSGSLNYKNFLKMIQISSKN
ncbi:triose-phosphate isomerase [Buchnera aphidicola]|uniref:triose-phosphate isomerase n=1 Tax=Buchnera aphidicola TaxID=9 RepID=UPI002237CAC1|nr:triose-phosphate isomerase [Buchnera aphidicola]MCW5197708.1 triose-phosphate isomerase [Buchnera aphidicola (Chaitophorus viminalis)]